ncbi:MAG TPA: hypothetical protein VG099_18330, partial [Gemmataceae bacterium]|nr:hypothetical protein [Gemmataceae bacterium]
MTREQIAAGSSPRAGSYACEYCSVTETDSGGRLENEPTRVMGRLPGFYPSCAAARATPFFATLRADS